MRVPLSWLKDFSPFDDDPAALAETLSDLGLVVEAIERVGEGLDGVVVARVDRIAAISGADRIRRVEVDAGDGPREIVCGATNFAVGDLVPLAPVGVTLPGGFTIARRTMKGVTSDGMLCSGRELGLTDDHEGLLVLDDVEGARPGASLAEVLGVVPDVVFDVTVEGNRPDAWSMAGVARDLAARLHLPYRGPTPTLPGPASAEGPSTGRPVEELATVVVEDVDLCPRMTVKVLTGIDVGPSPAWLARRLVLAGMRPINSVVDASNYVMLELGQPTHPYDLDRLVGPGLVVRRARPGETVQTLDGVVRTLGIPGRGLGDVGEDCLICDADGTPVGIGGIMGGTYSEISPETSRVLLEAAYFNPMAIARTSKRLGLRTEASARFERGCDPWGIDRAAERFCELVGGTVATGVLDVRGDVPGPVRLRLPVARVNAVLGTGLSGAEVSSLIGPIGFVCQEDGSELTVAVPTNRPDVRPPPHGVEDVIEEVARTFGYSSLPRRRPSWPDPGRLSDRQRSRRLVRDVLCGVGASEAWTPTFVSDDDHARMGLGGPSVSVANPLVADESRLRRSLLPGLCRAVAYNVDRRADDVRLFEVGTVFAHPAEVPGRSGDLPIEREVVSVVLAGHDDDAHRAVAAWSTLAGALGLGHRAVELVADGTIPGLHPTRSARLVVGASGQVIGAVGEIDPELGSGLVTGLPVGRRLGWLEVDLGPLLDPHAVARRHETARPVSRYPSADVDLALVVGDEVTADRVASAIEESGGDLLESVHLFDVYRGGSVGPGRRSLAFRLRFCAADRTLTDDEVAACREQVLRAVSETTGAELR
ncbi:MAG: phenylalanine--tRNA ligase subunit beta [Acidimicrobiales bacterium]